MEGQAILSDKLSFIENGIKIKVDSNVSVGKLITAANQHGLLYIGFNDKTIKAVRIEDIVDQDSTSKAILNLDKYAFSTNLSFKPYLLSVSRNGYSSVLLVAGQSEQLNYPEIEFFDIDTQTSIGKVKLSDFSGTRILDYSWQPVYYESIVAICLSSGHLLIVAVDKRKKNAVLVYKDQKNCLTCCWSPKGKNLAIGMTNGQIRRLEIGQLAQGFANFSFRDVDKSQINFSHLTPEYQAVKLRWINKKYLMCAHAKPSDPSTTFSICTIKPTESYRYFANVCMDTINPNMFSHYNVDLLNLTGAVICTSNTSGDVSVIGMAGAEQVKKNDIADWSLITIETEGARVELPLNSNNEETYSRGTAITFAKKFGSNPIIVIYTSDGLLCTYVAIHSERILKLPETQELESLTPSNTVEIYFHDFSNEIDLIRKNTEYNETFLSLLHEVNHLRRRIDEVEDIHKLHKEALDAVRYDIDALDIGMLENLYLIEYIKSRSKKSIDTRTIEKVEELRHKARMIGEKLQDLNDHVDASWEEFCRQRTSNKAGRRRNSLDIIYKTLATNQRIINFLEKRTQSIAPPPETPKFQCNVARRNPAKMKALKEFLASRNTVRVRRPKTVKVSFRSKLQL